MKIKLNPKLKDYLDENEDVTMIGIFWAMYWRFFVVVFVIFLVLSLIVEIFK